jgi:MFS family permease
MHPKGKFQFFYGYWILVAGLFLLLLYSGVGYYAFGIFFKPIQEELNLSRGVISVAFTMFYLVQAISSPFIGRLTDRYGPKKIINLGAFITGLGLTLLSLTTNLPHLYIAYAITGLGCSAMGFIPVSTVISNWFIERRGGALGIAGIGMGMGGLVLAPIIGIFLIPSFGWRTAYQILALLSVILVTVTAQFVIKTSPQEMALHPDGIESSKAVDETRNPSKPSGGWMLNEALKTSTFWLITGAFVMFNMAQVGITQHLVNHLTDIGFPLATATAALSCIGLGNAIGKFLFGYSSNRFAAKYCAAIGFLLGIVATSILITVNSTSPLVFIWVYALIMGLSIGCWVPLTSVLMSSSFGLAHYGAIYGVWSIFHNISVGISPTFFGYVYDSTHGYYWAFTVSLGFYSAATAFILALRRPKPHLTPSDKSS